MTTNRDDQNPLERQGKTELEEAVASSPLEAAPEGQTDAQGTSFYNPALTGSGTIMPDGTYGAPLPDPNLAKRNEDPNVTTELNEPEQPAASKATPAAKRTSRA